MGVSYKKLWKLIIDQDTTNVEVRKAAGISPATFTKLKKNEIVSLDVLIKLCMVLDCEIGDVVEVIKEQPTGKEVLQ
jgi:DNA-binding Xre family transcriptional regulator